MSALDGQVAVITGAASGMGRHEARRLPLKVLVWSWQICRPRSRR